MPTKNRRFASAPISLDKKSWQTQGGGFLVGLMIRERRDYVFWLLSHGIEIDLHEKRKLARKFGCSAGTIHSDIKLFQATEDDIALEYILRRRWSGHRIRAEKYGVPDTLTWDEFVQLFRDSDGVCPECGSNVGRQFLVPDHVISMSDGGPNSIENLRAICGLCNMRKH